MREGVGGPAGLEDCLTLTGGVRLPRLGLGTWGLREGQEIRETAACALAAGYRAFDAAAAYGNERGLGQALRESGLPRDDFFVTSKVWNADQGRGLTRRACLESLDRLGLERLDLYLLHWPCAGRSLEAWRDLEDLREAGLIRAAGVANFSQAQLGRLFAEARLRPEVNQIELHPYRRQEELVAFCRAEGVAVMAYSPLARGRVVKHQFFEKIGRRHGRTAAQTVLRWHWQKGVALVPKSVRPDRVRENADFFGFELSPEEMAAIDRQNQDRSVLKPPFQFDENGWVVEPAPHGQAAATS
ncbi:MAG: aldo/keto reductase [Deltaproteobacteria bacterium]|jgi:diketogulonate reductase-like aldo/keto reductase|nr:aldo/keto reductase [Deltaproteobacteria bacterium]